MQPRTPFLDPAYLPLVLVLTLSGVSCRDATAPVGTAGDQAAGARRDTHGSSPVGSLIFTCLSTEAPPGNAELCTMNADGSGRTQITNNVDINDFNPDLSTNGKQVVFTSNRDFGAGSLFASLYVMNLDGSKLRRLTFDEAFDKHATWSPNGKQIAFTRQTPDFFGDPDLSIINSDGTELQSLASRAEIDQEPAWSPDGKEIAFSSNFGDPNGLLDIHIIHPDGTGERNFTNTPDRSEQRPAWSPNGKQLAYAVTTNLPDANIFVRNADGTDERQLTTDPARESDPAWSPDGKRIYYVKHVDGVRDIFVMNTDGSGQANLTNTPTIDEFQIHVR